MLKCQSTIPINNTVPPHYIFVKVDIRSEQLYNNIYTFALKLTNLNESEVKFTDASGKIFKIMILIFSLFINYELLLKKLWS